MASQVPQNLTTKQRNDRVWDSMKEEIRQLLLVDGKSLQETRDIIKDRHGFSASERKWKMKRREWEFNTYIPSADMRFMVNKAEKRLREENKETVLSYQGSMIEQQRLNNFKKRKPNPDDTVLDVATPADITYHTPSSMDDVIMEPVSQITPALPNENQASIDHGISNPLNRTVLSEGHQFAASNEYNPGMSRNDSKGAVEMALDSQSSRDKLLRSSDLSGPETPPVSSNSTSSTTNEECKFPYLRALREESWTTDDHILSLKWPRITLAFPLHSDLQKFPRYVQLPIQGEDLRFLKQKVESVRNNSVAEDHPTRVPSDFLSKDHQTSEFWDEFIELIELVLVKWPSTPQDWHLSRFLELVLSSEAAFGLENWITVSLVCRYADFLVMVGYGFDAEDVLRKVIAKLPNRCSALRLHCRLSLAALLFLTARPREAVTMLESIILAGLQAPSHTHLLFFAHVTWSSQYLQFIGRDIPLSAESIMISVIEVQQKVLKSYSNRVSLERTWFNALVGFGRIAEMISESGSFSLADELFSSVRVAIATLSGSLHGSKISTIFSSLSSHHQRQNLMQDFRIDILNAYNFLESDTSLDLSTKALLDSMPRLESVDGDELEIIAEKLTIIQRNSELNELDDIVLSEDSTVNTESTIDYARELVISIPIRGDSGWETYAIPRRDIIGQEDTMTSRTSNKYGVTFSVSEMTGISYSEFMVP